MSKQLPGLGIHLNVVDLTVAPPFVFCLELRPMGIRMLVTITIPETEERTVALVQDLVTLLRKYPGVQVFS
jgi:hypothetical protein